MEEEPKICLYCIHCIPIGEGDHICDAFDEPVLILEDYTPTDDFLKCGTSEHETWDEFENDILEEEK